MPKKWSTKQVTQFEGKYTGAISGIFDLTEPAEQILGRLDPGQVFIYLFRRFGYPRFGWDDVKELVTYHLTTPVDGVVLTVRPNVTRSGTFGYMLREDLDHSCEDEYMAPSIEWYRQCEAWALKEHGIEILRIFEQDTDKIQRVWDKWASDKEDKDFDDQAAVNKAFLEDQATIRDKYTRQYKDIEPFPQRISIQDRDDNSIMKQCYTALCDTIRDLERPVYVKDVLIDITGELTPSEKLDGFVVDYSNMAGIGVGDKLDDTKPKC